MNEKNVALGWRVLGTFAAICLVAVLMVPTAGAAPASDTSAAAERVWNKLLTRCGGSYFYVGSAFDHGGMLSGVGAGSHPTVIEFHGVKFNTVPVRVSDADRMNGMSAHARITMLAHLYRDDGGAWQDGPDLQMRNTNDVFSRAIQDIAGDAGELGNGGAMAFDLIRFKGAWAIGRSSTTMSGPLTFDTNYYDVSKLISLPAARYDCKVGTVIPPPPTPAELTAKAEAVRKAEEQVRQNAEAAKVKAAHDAEVRARGEALRAVINQRETPWRFEGTPDEFMRALRVNLAKRGVQYGFDPATYNDELRQISEMVQTCMTVSPEDWRQADAAFGSETVERTIQSRPNLISPRLARLKGCDGGREVMYFGERISKPGKDYGVGVVRSMTIGDGPTRAAAPYFTIKVMLFLKSGDWAHVPDKYIEAMPSYSEVIDAKIPYPAKVAGL